MRKIWNYVSVLGLESIKNKLEKRNLVLTNQLNFVIFYTMSLLLIATFIILFLTSNDPSFGTLRVAFTIVLSLMSLILSGLGYTQISRFILIFIPPIVFLIGPTIIGYVEEESYTYYSYCLICFSIIPQMIINPKKERLLFWLSMFYYFVLAMIIDKVMVSFSTNSFPIVDRINTFYPTFKLAHITLFILINACVYYLRSLNFKYEADLNRSYRELELQNVELKAQKEEIERQKDEIIHKETSTWQKLVKIISHEIVNSAIPINNLAGMTAQMLEDESGNVQDPKNMEEDVTRDIHQGLKVIESRTLGLISFVQATKSLTDISKPNPRPLLVSDLVNRVMVLYGPRFRSAGVKFSTKIEPEDISIVADLEMIEQVLINLIQNSLEAMSESNSPELFLKAEIKGPNVNISLTDNGKGIKEEILGKIFLPFYSTKESGSGIGLSLSQQIMMLHNGRLEVSSVPSSGATFTMVF